jgi:prefoldin subunit 5
MNKTPAEQKRQNPMEDYELRLRQIDSDIERLNKQLNYLHRVRAQYAQLLEQGQQR